MPISFTEDEVREFLEEQGFDVSDERTLKNFIHDLKKLIKYEDMQRRRRKLGHPPDETNLDSTDGRPQYTTTTSSVQDSSSPYDEGEDNLENDENSQHQFEEAVRVASSASVPMSSKKSYMKKALDRSPVRPQRSFTRQGPTGDTGSYGTSGTASYDNNGDSNDQQRQPIMTKKRSKEQPPVQWPQPTVQKPLSGNVIRAQPTSTAPSKKKGNRLIMKRVTASQDINGDSVIEESDIDLGPVRRQMYQHQPLKKNPTVFTRPKTAPQINNPEAGSSKRPISSQQNSNLADAQDPDKFLCDSNEDFNPDELFHALSELIFPCGQGNSDDSLLAENDNRTKTLLKPPPHVARDPVLLYHWYKTCNWDMYSIPGEDRHMKLRWNVRAKTVGGYHPCVETRQISKPKSAR